uniref:Uncharacterized protein n=1 Tax=Marseillevirus LCMAC101 TaxID=2506602 RepID=A0A481YRX6_9VIRU|nr:MAG: hypothetical protein LCMAC101_05330 [Marseillevirus LCMAC101]
MADNHSMITYFISGHIDLEEEEFEKYYRQKIDTALDDGASFVVGDARGADSMAQQYLKQKTEKVTVYHMYEKPLHNYGNFSVCGGFKSHSQKDAAMTKISTKDIAWIRSPDTMKRMLGDKYDLKRKSGTERNLLRRKKQS